MAEFTEMSDFIYFRNSEASGDLGKESTTVHVRALAIHIDDFQDIR